MIWLSCFCKLSLLPLIRLASVIDGWCRNKMFLEIWREAGSTNSTYYAHTLYGCSFLRLGKNLAFLENRTGWMDWTGGGAYWCCCDSRQLQPFPFTIKLNENPEAVGWLAGFLSQFPPPVLSPSFKFLILWSLKLWQLKKWGPKFA